MYNFDSGFFTLGQQEMERLSAKHFDKDMADIEFMAHSEPWCREQGLKMQRTIIHLLLHDKEALR